MLTASGLHRELVGELRGLRGPDGGFPTSVDGPSEVEPTTVAALALEDAAARSWLAAHQRADGGFDEGPGRASGPSTAAFAALALGGRGDALRAVAFAIEHRGLPLPNAADTERRVGWGWTPDTRSLVEPTSRVLLAVKALVPADRATRDEAVGLLAERQCQDGGWNYGNASVYDVDLRGYAQTTAIALVGLQGERDALVAPGLRFLRQQWPREPGGLTAAQAIVAFRLHRQAGDAAKALGALEGIASRPSFRDRPLTVAWAALATGPDNVLDRLRPRR